MENLPFFLLSSLFFWDLQYMEEEMRELGRSMRVTSRIRLSLKRDDRWECALLSRSSYVRMYVCTFGSHYEDTMGRIGTTRVRLRRSGMAVSV